MAELEYFPLDDLPDNSFLVIRVDVPGTMDKYIAATNLAKSLKPHMDLLKQKKVTLMIMTPKEKFEILTEQEMNQAGWYRKT